MITTVHEIVLTCPPVTIDYGNSQTTSVKVHYTNARAVGGQGYITLFYSIPSGGDFYLGETTVAVTAVDSTRVVVQCTFPVFVAYQGKALI